MQVSRRYTVNDKCREREWMTESQWKKQKIKLIFIASKIVPKTMQQSKIKYNKSTRN